MKKEEATKHLLVLENTNDSMESNIKLFVPTHDQRIVKILLRQFSKIFGGATCFLTMGSWQDEKQNTVFDKIAIIETYLERKELQKGVRVVSGIAEIIKRKFEQESVAMVVDGRFVLI